MVCERLPPSAPPASRKPRAKPLVAPANSSAPPPLARMSSGKPNHRIDYSADGLHEAIEPIEWTAGEWGNESVPFHTNRFWGDLTKQKDERSRHCDSGESLGGPGPFLAGHPSVDDACKDSG